MITPFNAEFWSFTMLFYFDPPPTNFEGKHHTTPSTIKHGRVRSSRIVFFITKEELAIINLVKLTN